MQFSRFMTVSEFARELDVLRAFRSQNVDTKLLESLEEAGLLHPRIRIHYPDTVARRFWLLTHERQLKHPIEPDGPRWKAAVEFDKALHRWQSWIAYGLSPNPTDDPAPQFSEFVEFPSKTAFVLRLDRRVDVSNDVEDVLFDDINFEDRYSTWQLLLAAEVADAGVHMRINLADENTWRIARECLYESRVPEGTKYIFNFAPVHATRDFARHEKALDAVVWFTEERWRTLSYITKGQGGRFRLSTAQSVQYEDATKAISKASVARFGVGADELVAAARFLATRWSEWNRQGRPLVAEAYKELLGQTVLLTRRACALTFAEVRDRVGLVSGWFKPILDIVWPDWAEEQKERVRLTLKSALATKNAASATEANIDAFVDFLATEGQEAFFWRLMSFEDHALRGNEYAIEGMKADVQGMAVIVEHVAGILGGTEMQLHQKFGQLWRDAQVQFLLKRNDVSTLLRQRTTLHNWTAQKAKFEGLRSEPGGEVVADLVVAHRVRASVHDILPEDDHFELESLFIGLMRAALLTFVEVRGHATVVAPAR